MTLQELSRQRNWMKGKVSRKLSGEEIYSLTLEEHEIYGQILRLQDRLLKSWNVNSKKVLNDFTYWGDKNK